MTPRNPNRAIVRVDQQVIETPEGFLNHEVLARIVRQIDELRKQMEVIVVTSGTIAAGREIMERPRSSQESRSRQRALSTVGSVPIYTLYNELSAAHTLFVQVLTSQEHILNPKQRGEIGAMIDSMLQYDSVPLVMDNFVTTNRGFDHPRDLARMMETITHAKGIWNASEEDGLRPDAAIPFDFETEGAIAQAEIDRREEKARRKHRRRSGPSVSERMKEIEKQSIGGQFFETETRLAYGYYKLAPGPETGTYFMRCICCHAIGERVTARPWRKFESRAACVEAFAETLGTFVSATDVVDEMSVSGPYASDSGCEEEKLLEIKTNKQIEALIERILASSSGMDETMPPKELKRRLNNAHRNADKQNYKFMRGRAAAEEGLDVSAGMRWRVLLNSTQDAYICYEIASTDKGCALKYTMGYLVGDRRYRQTNEWMRIQDREEGLEALLRNARALFGEEPHPELPENGRKLHLEAQKNMLAMLKNLEPSQLEDLPVISDERFDHEQQIRRWKATLRSFPDQRKEIEREGRKELGDELFDKILAELRVN